MEGGNLCHEVEGPHGHAHGHVEGAHTCEGTLQGGAYSN